MFDWFGYQEVPHPMRYGVLIFLITAPIYAILFVKFCMENEKEDDPVEEEAFLRRVDKWENIR